MQRIDSWFVPEQHAGLRLDKFLVRQVAGLGRAMAALWIAEGRVRVNAHPARKSRLLVAGEKVSLEFPDRAPIVSDPDAPLQVVLEHEHWVVVEKPAGQASAPLVPGESGTLANALLGRYPEMAAIGYREREPGLLHRLDTHTSGLMLAARTTLAFDVLRDALQERRLAKQYLAIVLDRDLPTEQVVIREALTWVEGSGRVQIATASGQPLSSRPRPIQESRVRVLERRRPWALVEVEAKRAFRHQVRVHLASRGWPIVGDKLYGGEAMNALERRHALHASHVAWAGDARLSAFAADSALPEDLRAFWDR